MDKWNPFKKNILEPDQDEFAGSGDSQYGVPRDAATADALGVMPDDTSSSESTKTPEKGEGMQSEPAAGDGVTSSADYSGAASSDQAGAPEADDTAAAGGPGPETLNAADAWDNSAPEAADVSGQADMNAEAAGEYAGPEDAGTFRSGASGSGDADSTKDADSAKDAGGFGSQGGTDSFGSTAGTDGFNSTAGTDGFGGTAGPDAPGGPAGPAGPGSGGPHDFEDDEPKFDTQTGEPLDKPKKKLPAIILTAAVSVFAIGAFIYSVNPGALPSRQEATTDEQVETDVTLAIAEDESETEGQAVTEAEQTEADQSAAAQTKPEAAGLALAAADTTEAAGEETAGTETAQTKETEAETEKSNGKGSKKEKLSAASKPDEQEKAAKPADEEQTETETETEPGTEAVRPEKVPQFKTEGVTVSSSLDVADMVEDVMPEIVSVTSTSIQMVRDFFYGTQRFEQTDAGSGIIIGKDDSNVYIVTDAFILNDASEVTTGFSVPNDLTEDLADEDTLAPASLVGIDSATGLAVLKVSLDDINETVAGLIKPAVLGDSDGIRVGQRAIAIGNAMGRGLSVTQGIISAVDRAMQYASGEYDFIQTDASINYGNYGGALLNEDGEVIGINAGKITDDSSEGMGFAFPINLAKEVIVQMLPEFGELYGIETAAASGGKSDADDEASQEVKEQEETKAKKEQEETKKQLETLAIADDYDEEPASEPDDEKKSEDVKSEETEKSSGKAEAKETEKSSGKAEAKETEKADDTKEESEAEEKETQGIAAAREEKGQLGIQVGEYSKEDQIIYRVPAGAVIASVVSGSGAETAGLAAGDLICGIDDEKVESVEDLQTALSDKKPGDKVEVSFLRPDEDSGYDEDAVMSVTVTLQ